MDLPLPSPLWREWLFENPWPVVLVLIAAAAVLRVVGVRRANLRLARAWWLLVPLAAVGYGLAHVVQTGREQVIAQTRALIAATVVPEGAARMDAERVLAFFDERATLEDPDGNVLADVMQMRGHLAAVADRFPIASQAMVQLRTQTTSSTRAVTTLELRTVFSQGIGTGVPLASEWWVEWGRSGAGEPAGRWRVTRLRWLKLMDRVPQRQDLP
jgi:hypothetical protein